MIKIILWTIIVVFLASLIAAFVSMFCKRYGGTGDRSVSYPFFSAYGRDEAFPQDTDLSPVPPYRRIVSLNFWEQ